MILSIAQGMLRHIPPTTPARVAHAGDDEVHRTGSRMTPPARKPATIDLVEGIGGIDELGTQRCYVIAGR